MITSLELKNFKCFGSLERPMNFSQINLLTGSNGKGKSTIFQSLLLLAQSYSNGRNIEYLRLNGSNVKLGNYFDVLTRNSKEEKFSITYSTDDNDENFVSFEFKPNHDDLRIGQLSSLKIKYDDKEVEIVGEVGADDSNLSNTLVSSSNSAIKAINQLRNIYFISADRQGPRNYVDLVDECNSSIGIHGEYVINILQKKSDILNDVIRNISYIMGGAMISIKEIEREYIKLLIDSKDDSDGYKPMNVGFGYSYILPIVVLPLIVDEKSKLFIENPEAHLHPGAQSRLANYLIQIAKQRNLQLFIETHSDHIVNALRIATKDNKNDLSNNDSTILHITRNNDGTSCFYQINLDKSGNLSQYPQEFMDEWTNQLIYLL